MPYAKRVGRTVSVSRSVLRVFRMLRCYSPRLFQIRWRGANNQQGISNIQGECRISDGY